MEQTMKIMRLIKGRLALVLPRCNRMTFMVSQGMYRKLWIQERIALKAHLGICRRCVDYHHQLELMRDFAREQGQQRNDNMESGLSAASLTAETRDHIKRFLAEAEHQY